MTTTQKYVPAASLPSVRTRSKFDAILADVDALPPDHVYQVPAELVAGTGKGRSSTVKAYLNRKRPGKYTCRNVDGTVFVAHKKVKSS